MNARQQSQSLPPATGGIALRLLPRVSAMDGLKLTTVLLLLYAGALGAFVVASTRVPRMRAWYLPHVRAFALLLLPAIVGLFVVIGVEATR